jgi:peptidoglycan/LPS O-acetylase OafA/YrhL
MTAAFLGGGALLGALALGLRRALGPGLGPRLLFAAGAALMLLAAPADPTIRDTPATTVGRLHDAAFALLGLSFLPALLALAARLRADGPWRDLAAPTLAVALLAAPAFLIKGLFFYAFFAAALAWVGAISARLWRLGG